MQGVTLKMFDSLKPIAVTQQVTVAIVMQNMPEFKVNEQLDTYFQTYGKESGKKIVALETVEQQAELLFASTSISSQANDLLEALSKPEAMVDEAKKLNEAYFSQDLVAMFNLTKQENSNPEFFEKLLNNRNENWLKQLPEIMKADSSFIAIGCLHLAGEHGLVEQLRKLGYTVEAM